MGISGVIYPLSKPKNLAKVVSQIRRRSPRVGVDASSWIYEYIGDRLASNVETKEIANFVANRVKRINSLNIFLTLVFDGQYLEDSAKIPVKIRLQNQINSSIFDRGFWTDMANAIIRTMQNDPQLAVALNKYVVAPYEADAQLAYLANNSSIDAIITRDGDLIGYGCKQIFFNLDYESWDYREYNRANLTSELEGLNDVCRM